MTSRVKLIEGIQMVGESGSGHTVVMDGSPEVGGRNMGVRPMELFLIGLGGCANIDVLNILRKGRHIVTDCEVVLQGERAEEDPKVYLAIQIHFIVTGKDIPAKAVERAIQLSEEKYCSAAAMLSKTAEIRTSFEIRELTSL
ncbi:MAG: OsmC family protein [Magnetococcales bacterium]|nr:OsmC family protein [Magnetococcales bacterium]MBF0438902.1 OsmC family protein [Magnetococcales bacterium]